MIDRTAAVVVAAGLFLTGILAGSFLLWAYLEAN